MNLLRPVVNPVASAEDLASEYGLGPPVVIFGITVVSAIVFAIFRAYWMLILCILYLPSMSLAVKFAWQDENGKPRRWP